MRLWSAVRAAACARATRDALSWAGQDAQLAFEVWLWLLNWVRFAWWRISLLRLFEMSSGQIHGVRALFRSSCFKWETRDARHVGLCLAKGSRGCRRVS